MRKAGVWRWWLGYRCRAGEVSMCPQSVLMTATRAHRWLWWSFPANTTSTGALTSVLSRHIDTLWSAIPGPLKGTAQSRSKEKNDKKASETQARHTAIQQKCIQESHSLFLEKYNLSQHNSCGKISLTTPKY